MDETQTQPGPGLWNSASDAATVNHRVRQTKSLWTPLKILTAELRYCHQIFADESHPGSVCRGAVMLRKRPALAWTEPRLTTSLIIHS